MLSNLFGSAGSALQVTLWNNGGFLLALLPPGAFLGLALLIALRNMLLQGRTAARTAATRESAAAVIGMNATKRAEIFRRLAESNPNPDTELRYHSPFELLVSVILSAQATDVSVNKATGSLYRVANTPAKILALGEAGLKRYIKTIGLFNTKARNIIKTCGILIESHGGKVPNDRAALEALPGVGTQDGQRDSEYSLRRTHDCSRYAHLSRQQPYKARDRGKLHSRSRRNY